MNHFNPSQYLPFLESVLTPGRFQHSLGVMQTMQQLSKIYDLDEDQALTAGLLHDAAKDLSPDQIDQIVSEAQIEFHHPSEYDYVLYLHGPVGAYYVQKELGIADPAVIDAIYKHTWFGEWKNSESPLVWCLRFSDILEPNRRWDHNAQKIKEGEPLLRQAAFAGYLEEAAYLHTDMIIKFNQDTNKPIHPNLYLDRENLTDRLKKSEKSAKG